MDIIERLLGLGAARSVETSVLRHQGQELPGSLTILRDIRVCIAYAEET